MLTDQYELFIDPEDWPDAQSIGKLAAIWGFDDAKPSTPNIEDITTSKL